MLWMEAGEEEEERVEEQEDRGERDGGGGGGRSWGCVGGRENGDIGVGWTRLKDISRLAVWPVLMHVFGKVWTRW